MARTTCLGERQNANLSGLAVYSGSFAGAIAARKRANAADQVQRGCMVEKETADRHAYATTIKQLSAGLWQCRRVRPDGCILPKTGKRHFARHLPNRRSVRHSASWRIL